MRIWRDLSPSKHSFFRSSLHSLPKRKTKKFPLNERSTKNKKTLEAKQINSQMINRYSDNGECGGYTGTAEWYPCTDSRLQRRILPVKLSICGPLPSSFECRKWCTLRRSLLRNKPWWIGGNRFWRKSRQLRFQVWKPSAQCIGNLRRQWNRILFGKRRLWGRWQ